MYAVYSETKHNKTDTVVKGVANQDAVLALDILRTEPIVLKPSQIGMHSTIEESW